MNKNELKKRYFEWLCMLVPNHTYISVSYKKLLSMLDNIDFTYIVPMDGNRYEDGIELRYRFGYEQRYDERYIAEYLDDRPCSVLEMMVALAIRIEEHIMDDPEIGNRTGLWFWNMIKNLNLKLMHDYSINEEFVREKIQRFLERKYARNGMGGLFTIEGSNKDLREAEIWYQACWYLDNVI